MTVNELTSFELVAESSDVKRLSTQRIGFGRGMVMFIHAHTLHSFTDTKSSRELQQEEGDGRKAAGPQNHHDDEDELGTNGRATIAFHAATVGGRLGHAAEATPTVVVILTEKHSGCIEMSKTDINRLDIEMA